MRETPERGGNAVLTFMPHRQQNFARTTALLDQMGLNILDARITPLDGGLSLDTYLVLEDNGAPITDRHRAHEIEQQLWRVAAEPDDATLAGGHAARTAAGAHVHDADADHVHRGPACGSARCSS